MHCYRKCQGDQHDGKLYNMGETDGYLHDSMMPCNVAENKVSLGYSHTQKYTNHLCRTKVQMEKIVCDENWEFRFCLDGKRIAIEALLLLEFPRFREAP